MMRKLREARDEEGFTLIELLVVVIIIGILAAIAIPVFLNQRERAWVAAAESDVRNAAIEVESYFAENDAYPDAAGFAALNIQVSGGANPVALTYTPVGTTSYTIAADHPANGAGQDALYDSAAGGLQ